MPTEAVLIDISSLVHVAYHATANAPNPDQTSIDVLAAVYRIASGHPHVAICCDSKVSLRRQADPTYKANRPKEDRAPLYHQMDRVIAALKADGFPVWEVEGYEADDVIAAGVAEALKAGGTARVVSADKDLCQLVGPSVRVEKLDGTIYDEAAVVVKFGVTPAQLGDWLCLVGDTSDNVKGCTKVGAKTATELLTKYGTLEGIYDALTNRGTEFTPALASNLREFQPRVDDVRALIRLRTPAIPFSEIAAERVPQGSAMSDDEMREMMPDAPVQSAPAPVEPAKTAELVRYAPAAPAAAPAEWERQLEPRSLDEARSLAKWAFESKLFGAYGSPQAIMLMIMAGRDFGFSSAASLRAFDVVKGKPVLKADAVRALVMRNPAVKFFRMVERTSERCTFTAQRVNDDAPTTLTYTMEEAKAAGLASNDNYRKHPADMLVARCSAKLARIIAPESTFGVYVPEEFD